MTSYGSKSVLESSDVASMSMSSKLGEDRMISSDLKFRLIQAAAAGDIELFKEHKDMLKGRIIFDYDKRSPLHLAAAEGHVKVVQFLIEELQYDPEFKDRNNKTAFDDAKKENRTEVVEYLNSRIDPSIRYEVIEHAASGDLEFLKRKHKDGVDLSHADYDQRTPLHLAAAEGHRDVIKFLIEECKVDYNVRDRWGRTPFGEARRSGNTEIENLILVLTGIM